jgi:exodeoxyribonuclease VIII
MLDIETLGHKPNAYIVAIGAVNFKLKDGIVGEFYRAIKLVPDDRFSIDPQTVGWWLNQSENARKALFKDAVHIHEALKDLSEFVKNTEGVWGNGATFDNVIIREAYTKVNIKCPWHFKKDKCYRTVINLYPKTPLIREGEHHNALDDAKTQANHMLKLHELYNVFNR